MTFIGVRRHKTTRFVQKWTTGRVPVQWSSVLHLPVSLSGHFSCKKLAAVMRNSGCETNSNVLPSTILLVHGDSNENNNSNSCCPFESDLTASIARGPVAGDPWRRRRRPYAKELSTFLFHRKVSGNVVPLSSPSGRWSWCSLLSVVWIDATPLYTGMALQMLTLFQTIKINVPKTENEYYTEMKMK